MSQDRFPTLTFPSEQDETVLKELRSLVSRIATPLPIDIPFSQSNFEVRGLSISINEGQINTFSYIREGPDLFFIELATFNFTLAGVAGPSGFLVRIPENRSAGTKQQVAVGHGADNGVFMPLRIVAGFALGKWIGVFKSDLTAWTPSAQTQISFQMRVRLAPVAT